MFSRFFKLHKSRKASNISRTHDYSQQTRAFLKTIHTPFDCTLLLRYLNSYVNYTKRSDYIIKDGFFWLKHCNANGKTASSKLTAKTPNRLSKTNFWEHKWFTYQDFDLRLRFSIQGFL